MDRQLFPKVGRGQLKYFRENCFLTDRRMRHDTIEGRRFHFPDGGGGGRGGDSHTYVSVGEMDFVLFRIAHEYP